MAQAKLTPGGFRAGHAPGGGANQTLSLGRIGQQTPHGDWPVRSCAREVEGWKGGGN